MHGILDNRAVVENLLEQTGRHRPDTIRWSDYPAFKQQQYDMLAQHIRDHVDLSFIYRSLQRPQH
jgi:adenosylcobyric acid synthase